MKYLLITLIYSVFTTTAWAVNLIVPLPGAESSIFDPGTYIKTIFTFGIGLAGLLAMAQIVFGAVQYTVSAGNPSRQGDAKDRILNSIYGLLLLLSSFVLLNTINPKLTQLSLEGLEPLGDVSGQVKYFSSEKLSDAARERALSAVRQKLEDDIPRLRENYEKDKSTENKLALLQKELAINNALQVQNTNALEREEKKLADIAFYDVFADTESIKRNINIYKNKRAEYASIRNGLDGEINALGNKLKQEAAAASEAKADEERDRQAEERAQEEEEYF